MQTHLLIYGMACLAWGAPAPASGAGSSGSKPITAPLVAHATNPNYFADGTGKAIYLTGSHTWNNLQDWGTNGSVQRLDFTAYVKMLVDHNHNLTLLWSTELPAFRGLPSTESSPPDFFVAPQPWQRTGPGNASDRKLKFDLTRFNPAYFDRLRDRVERLNAAGIYAGVYLFSGEFLLRFRFSGDGYPFTGSNNVNGIDDGGGTRSVTMTAPDAITAIQDAYVKKVIDTLSDLPNVLWIVSQEAPADSKWWNGHLIALVRSYEAGKPLKHKIGYGVPADNNDATILNSDADWIAPAARISPTSSCGSGHPRCKVNINDSDHSYFGMWNDSPRANRNYFWINFTNGNQTLFMDPYVVYYPRENRNLCPSPVNGIGSRPDPRWNNVRATMGYIRGYADRINLGAMTPQGKLTSTGHALASTDATRPEFLAYAPSGGEFTVNLQNTRGPFAVEWMNAGTGAKLSGADVMGGATITFTPPFGGDAVLYLRVKGESCGERSVAAIPPLELKDSQQETVASARAVAAPDTGSLSLWERAGVRVRMTRWSEDAHPAIQLAKAPGGAGPSPQPSPQGEGARNNPSAAGVLWRGVWSASRVSGKPLPVMGADGTVAAPSVTMPSPSLCLSISEAPAPPRLTPPLQGGERVRGPAHSFDRAQQEQPSRDRPSGAANRKVSASQASATTGEYARFARSARGEASRGRALFADPKRLACFKCHRVRGEGGEAGPDLSDVGAKFNRDLLIESVLEPSRQIVEGYRPAVVATADGRVLTGVVKEESAAELTLVDVDARRQVVRKSDIQQRKIGDISIMPAGLASGVSRQEFADLIAYLETLRSAGQGTPGSGVTGPLALPPGFASVIVASGITGATAMEVASDGRVFVCEQTGTLRIVKDGAFVAQPFVKLEVDSQWERGLIGVALDPDFEKNGYVYVNSVAPRPYPHHRLSRFTARGDVAVRGSEVVLFDGDDQTKMGGVIPAGHQGGAIHFGKDRKLYVALGEQTAGVPAQRMDSLLGKLLRLNPDGSIPEDNPFFETARGKYRAIWALGLRNPFSFAVQPGTGRIFINDVGEARWEEVDEGFAGANYGWPAAEGPSREQRFRNPIHHYPVASVAGGDFCPTDREYRFPPQYRGKYFFMDFVKGWIKVLDPDRPERVETFATGLTRPVDLKFAPDGSLYVLERDAWVVDGSFRPGTGSLLQIRLSSRPVHKAGTRASH